MPSTTTLNLTDIVIALAESERPFTEIRAELVDRVRTAEFYRADDVVLRSMVDAMEQASDVDDLDRHLNVFLTWAQDTGRVQVISLPDEFGS